jgi:isopentenyl diphosphate isomerase/L-lactate dehydrogenase-like FMN-dependent dehydrogenase
MAAAGQPGVERTLGNLRDEIERGMKLMGVKSVSELNRDRLRWR